MVYGSWPDGQIDHINGVRDDNRIENLRVVTSAENHKNMALGTASTSGVAGVSWHERDARWRAHIKVGGRQKHLGNFRRFEDAVSARLTANAALGFSERHGMDARVSA